MVTHSSTLAWRIQWTEEAGRLMSMLSQRGGHNRATSLSLFTCMPWRRKWQPTPVFLPGESQRWRSLVGCHLWGRTELDMTEATEQWQHFLVPNYGACALLALIPTFRFAVLQSLSQPSGALLNQHFIAHLLHCGVCSLKQLCHKYLGYACSRFQHFTLEHASHPGSKLCMPQLQSITLEHIPHNSS